MLYTLLCPGVLHVAILKHLRHVHGASREQLTKYARIKRRLQDLRRRKCAHCHRHFRVVSLRAHERKCAATRQSDVRDVDDAAQETEESCDEAAGADLSSEAVCEQVLALHNIRLQHEEEVGFIATCEFCGALVAVADFQDHLDTKHADLDTASFCERFRLVQRRIEARVDRSRKLRCSFCYRKFDVSHRKSLQRHEDRCALNPDRIGSEESVEKTEDEFVASGCWSCDICAVKVGTATSLQHHLTQHHRHHPRYRQLWDAANRARHATLQALTAGSRRKERDLRCATCRFRTKCADEMSAHKVECRAVTRQFVCHLCGKTMNLCKSKSLSV